MSPRFARNARGQALVLFGLTMILVVVMACITVSIAVKARDVGITEFLVKPFSAKTMARRITVVVENPRQFVRTDDFFGPDRRRHRVSTYTGEERRKDMMEKGDQQMSDDAVEKLLNEI